MGARKRRIREAEEERQRKEKAAMAVDGEAEEEESDGDLFDELQETMYSEQPTAQSTAVSAVRPHRSEDQRGMEIGADDYVKEAAYRPIRPSNVDEDVVVEAVPPTAAAAAAGAM